MTFTYIILPGHINFKIVGQNSPQKNIHDKEYNEYFFVSHFNKKHELTIIIHLRTNPFGQTTIQ